jgi:hypothetical protein
MNSYTEARNLLNHVTKYHSNKRIARTAQITKDAIIQINKENGEKAYISNKEELLNYMQ